ncbi:DUF4185 domain-containing protein [Gordonia sp. NB41Y]|uniref:DUF4185 domain-containing protein n=1 Tax=Gordonia sp. NB41Y TaxID=875808 RepID=UPI0006B16DC9|nr:DUF4185 domain-containing protein [Gordonia sp. NB41Y]EMP12662.2 carbohydrate-binding protein [Gordonia sp. NB41Y]WLP88955.1 DUF4185 domain-containing protein [Gordonia sp. NB41Y]
MRRSFARFRTALAVAATTAALTAGVVVQAPVAAAPAASGMGSIVARLTGPGAINDTVGRHDIIGTDLGVMWDNGRGEILTAFGDTQSFNGWSLLYGQLFYWRSNVLLRSTDRNLADGMTFTGHAGPPGHAKRLLKPNLRREVTIIPTAGIAANGKQYMSVMSVKHWGNPSSWITNWSGLVASTDNGANWHSVNAFRPNGGGNKKFHMSALLKVGDTVYTYGTPDGRYGAVYLARVPEHAIENLGAYEYFSYGRWVRNDPGAATPVMPAPTGELSVAWNSYLGKFISLSTTGEGVKLRTADNPAGPWSRGQLVVSKNDPYSGYAPYIHPWSTSGPMLYFTYSISYGYQVYLMRLPLQRS